MSISKWSGLRKYIGEFYDHIVFRHLEVDRNDSMIDKLEVFLKEVVGLKYGISASNFFINRPSVKPERGEFVDETRAFFCSELVAKAYKVLGIMTDPRPSHSFYPGTFSKSGKSTEFNSLMEHLSAKNSL